MEVLEGSDSPVSSGFDEDDDDFIIPASTKLCKASEPKMKAKPKLEKKVTPVPSAMVKAERKHLKKKPSLRQRKRPRVPKPAL